MRSVDAPVTDATLELWAAFGDGAIEVRTACSILQALRRQLVSG